MRDRKPGTSSTRHWPRPALIYCLSEPGPSEGYAGRRGGGLPQRLRGQPQRDRQPGSSTPPASSGAAPATISCYTEETGVQPPDTAPPTSPCVQLTHCRDHPERWHAGLRLDPEAGHVRLTLCSDPALLRECMQDLPAQAEAAAYELLISQRDAPRDQFSPLTPSPPPHKQAPGRPTAPRSRLLAPSPVSVDHPVPEKARKTALHAFLPFSLPPPPPAVPKHPRGVAQEPHSAVFFSPSARL